MQPPASLHLLGVLLALVMDDEIGRRCKFGEAMLAKLVAEVPKE